MQFAARWLYCLRGFVGGDWVKWARLREGVTAKTACLGGAQENKTGLLGGAYKNKTGLLGGA